MRKNFILYKEGDAFKIQEFDTPLQTEQNGKQVSKEKNVDVFICEAKSVMTFVATSEKKEIE